MKIPYFHSRLRIEKVDSETGENIIHDGALFRIYAAKRDVKKAGIGSVTGTGQALFGPAVDHEEIRCWIQMEKRTFIQE